MTSQTSYKLINRTFFMLTSLMLLVFASQAQSQDIHMKAGGVYSQLSGDTQLSLPDASYGIASGLVFSLDIDSRAEGRAELLYSRQGYEDVSFNALEVPAYIHLGTSWGGFNAGPTASYIFSSSIDYSDAYKQLQLGLSLGAELDLTQDIMLQSRYTFRYTDITDYNGIRLPVAELSLSYRIL